MRLIDAATLPYRLAVDDDGRQICYVRAEDIDKAPTIDPESLRPVGKWKWCGSDRWNDAYQCSECGEMNMDDSDYCPNCGARMEE